MAVLTQVHDIQFIRSIERDSDGVNLRLGDGRSIRLSTGHPHFAIWMVSVESKLREWHPVAFVEEGGWVVELASAGDSPVAWVRELPPGADGVQVAFDCHYQICALTRDHPEFDRVHATLAAAAGTRQMLWVATFPRETIEVGPDEEGYLYTLRRIVDARPAASRPAPASA